MAVIIFFRCILFKVQVCPQKSWVCLIKKKCHSYLGTAKMLVRLQNAEQIGFCLLWTCSSLLLYGVCLCVCVVVKQKVPRTKLLKCSHMLTMFTQVIIIYMRFSLRLLPQLSKYWHAVGRPAQLAYVVNYWAKRKEIQASVQELKIQHL